MTVSGIEPDGGAGQLELPFAARGPALDAVLDDVRDRFGTDAVKRAALLDRGEDMTPWLLSGDAAQGLEEGV